MVTENPTVIDPNITSGEVVHELQEDPHIEETTEDKRASLLQRVARIGDENLRSILTDMLTF